MLGVSPSYIHEIVTGKKDVKYPRPPLLAALHHAHYDLPTVPMLDDGRRYAAFRVEGDSMLPTLKDGWTVICDCAMECRNGDLVVAKHDGVALIKRFRRIGDTCLFMSDNPSAGKDYEVHASQVAWCLRVVKFMGEM